jgi:hypothetical protein
VHGIRKRDNELVRILPSSITRDFLSRKHLLLVMYSIEMPNRKIKWLIEKSLLSSENEKKRFQHRTLINFPSYRQKGFKNL